MEADLTLSARGAGCAIDSIRACGTWRSARPGVTGASRTTRGPCRTIRAGLPLSRRACVPGAVQTIASGSPSAAGRPWEPVLSIQPVDAVSTIYAVDAIRSRQTLRSSLSRVALNSDSWLSSLTRRSCGSCGSSARRLTRKTGVAFCTRRSCDTSVARGTYTSNKTVCSRGTCRSRAAGFSFRAGDSL